MSIRESASTISDRIRALEGAGITDVFIKKRVPSYAVQAASIGDSLQHIYSNSNSNANSFVYAGKTSSAKIYQNPVPPQNNISSLNSSKLEYNEQQQPEEEEEEEEEDEEDLSYSNLKHGHANSSSSEFLNEHATTGVIYSQVLPEMYRSPSVNSIENELVIANTNQATITSSNNNNSKQQEQAKFSITNLFSPSDLLDTKNKLRKVSATKEEDFLPLNQRQLNLDLELHNSSSTSADDVQIPILIPIENLNDQSINETSTPRQTNQINTTTTTTTTTHTTRTIKKDSLTIEHSIEQPTSDPPTPRAWFTQHESSINSIINSSNNLMNNLNSLNNTNNNVAAFGLSKVPSSPSSSYTSSINTEFNNRNSYDVNNLNNINNIGINQNLNNSILSNNSSYNSATTPTIPTIPTTPTPSSYSYSNSNQNQNQSHNRLLIFNSEYTKGMNQTAHTDHFSCWNCDQSLTGSRYILKDEHPYCIKCYEELFAHDCEECKKKIGTDSKDLSYKDKHWHEKCFFCHVCKLPLVDKPFGSKENSLYCGECYNQAFASRCDKCAQIFKPGMKKMEYKGQQFHENCFLCFTCNLPIGTKSFIPKENKIFCVPCYEQNFATKCTKCSKVISQGGVSYKNQPYHRECFNCTNCQQSLAGQRFTSRDDHPYCSECFGKLFAKKCFACHKPITVNPDLTVPSGQNGIGGTKYISFEDRHWHNDCFVCNRCHSSLVGRGFLTDAMDILCPECGKNEP